MYQLTISGASLSELSERVREVGAALCGETRPPFQAPREVKAAPEGVNFNPPIPPAPVDGEGPDPGTPQHSGPVDPAEVDAVGLPWDGRIHSSSRAVLQDGTWRQKRGVSETLLAAVTAELRSRLPGGNAARTEPAQPPAAPPAPSATPAAAPEPAPAFPWGAPPPAPAAPAVTHPGLIQQITRAIGAGILDHSGVMGLLRQHGVGSAAELEKRAETWAPISTALATAGVAYA